MLNKKNYTQSCFIPSYQFSLVILPLSPINTDNFVSSFSEKPSRVHKFKLNTTKRSPSVGLLYLLVTIFNLEHKIHLHFIRRRCAVRCMFVPLFDFGSAARFMSDDNDMRKISSNMSSLRRVDLASSCMQKKIGSCDKVV